MLSGMQTDAKPLLERAFELARAGANVDEIRHALRREGYNQVQDQLLSAALRRQLRAAAAAAKQSGKKGDDAQWT